MMTPDERELLDRVAKEAGLPRDEVERFHAEVEARLSKGAEEYRDNYRTKSFPELEAEAIEEQHDAGGWSCLALQLLQEAVAQGFPSDQAPIVRLHVVHGIALAMQSARQFEEAVALFREHEHEIQRPPDKPFSCDDARLSYSPPSP